MPSSKTACQCEVCGQRVRHGGTKASFIVGCTVKGISRVVHRRCRHRWLERRREIRMKWPELRRSVLISLPPNIRDRVLYYLRVA